MFNKIFFFWIFMISIGFQFDYELNSKNHSKNIKNVLDFFQFFSISFGFFSICFWFFLIFLIFFGLFFDFFDFFGFFSISIGFQLDFVGFQLDFNWIFSWALAKRQAWEKKIEKNQKPNPKFFFIFLILIGSIPKSNRIEIQKNQNKIKKIEDFFLSTSS